MRILVLNLAILGLFLLFLLAYWGPNGTILSDLVTGIQYKPADAHKVGWLNERLTHQLKKNSIDTDNKLTFVHWRAESGITFRHRIVNDAGPEIIANHYDHGNGLAAADVNNDGHIDIYFLNQVGANQLWINQGEGKFKKSTTNKQLAISDAVSVGASFADIDNDGDADLFVTTVMGGNRLFLNDGDGKFSDVSATSGLNQKAHSSGATIFDFDRDGKLDIFVSNVGIYTSETTKKAYSDWTNGSDPTVYICRAGRPQAFKLYRKNENDEPSLLYRGMGQARFMDVTEKTGLSNLGWNGDATAFDANNDGWQDLYILNMQGADRYLENINGQHFVDRTKDVFGLTPGGSMGVKAFDFNADTKLDLYITDMHSDMIGKASPTEEHFKSNVLHQERYAVENLAQLYGNALYVATDKKQYSEVSDKVGGENYWPWGISVDDLNADGFDDVFVTASMNYPFRYQTNHVLINDKGKKLIDQSLIIGAEPRKEGAIQPWFSLDCWGKNKSHPMCKSNKSWWKRYITVMAPRGSRSSLIADIDNDGDLDIITNEFNAQPLVMLNKLADTQNINWLKISLEGVRSNRDGLGAIVKVTAGDRQYVKANDGKSGYLAQSRLPLYFGLGENNLIDMIEVIWPSGHQQQIHGPLDTRKVVKIIENISPMQ